MSTTFCGTPVTTQTYMLDRKQYLLVSLGDALATFALYGGAK
jgi:hypothetical protein